MFVYVVGKKKRRRPVKIGYATTLDKRLSGIQTGSPDELMVYWDVGHLTKQEAKRIEATLHKRFADRRIRGEWFDVHADEASQALNELVDTRVMAARGLMCFDLRGYLAPEQIAAAKQVSLRSIEKQWPL